MQSRASSAFSINSLMVLYYFIRVTSTLLTIFNLLKDDKY